MRGRVRARYRRSSIVVMILALREPSPEQADKDEDDIPPLVG